MSTWDCRTGALGSEAHQHFASLETVFALRGERIARDPLSEVLRIVADGRTYYVKRYTGAGKNPLRRWFGRPRVRAEWENLQAFHAWGIPTAEVVAHGLEREGAAFSRGALVTAGIPDTTDLARLAQLDDPRLANPAWIARVSHQIARITRILHSHRFAHNDLKWRNLLVDGGPNPTVYLIDCPSGAFWRGPLLEYRIVKDLACLDKVARYRLSRTQRLRFYLEYTGHPHLLPADKARIVRIVRFFQGRE